MYRKHFGLSKNPFDKDLAPEDFFASAGATELEVRLRYLLDQHGIGLITGDVGSGKTSLCRKVVSTLHTGLWRTCYVPNSTGSVMDLYKSIAWELGLRTNATAPACTAPSATRSPASAASPKSARCLSWTRPSTCAPTSSRICAC